VLSVNEAQMVGHNTLLSQPKLTLVIDTPGDLDWYKLGQHYPTLAQQDPKEYGNEDSDTVMTFSTPEEMSHMKRMLDKMGAKYQEIGGTHQHPEVHERIGKVKDGYRLYSHSGKNLGTYPSKAGAEKRERQVQFFKHNK